jgi:hypothetical protein
MSFFTYHSLTVVIGYQGGGGGKRKEFMVKNGINV